MTGHRSGGRKTGVAKSGLSVAIVLLALAVVPSTLAHGSGQSVAPSLALAGGSSVEWAFGGSGYSNGACNQSTCAGSNLSLNGSFSASWNLSVHWVVIYNQTNVSSSQKEISAKAGIDASLSYSLSACTVVTLGQPCVTDTASVSLAGKALAAGWTNLTNGTVDLLSGPNGSGPVSAWAVTNSSSSESFNFSGSFSINSASQSISGSGSFVVGASEHSSIQFTPSLGLVPVNLTPGQTWTASAPFTALGSWAAGYAYNVAVSGSPPVSNSSWAHGSVTPSGTLTVNGSDLGHTLLWNNFSTPHTSVNAHQLELDFSGANFSAMDGWIFGPTDIYTGVVPSFTGFGNVSANSSESADFVPGTGFVGASLGANSSNVSAPPGPASFFVQAGPEPVGVAEAQYASIASGGSGSGGFPVLLVVGIVVVAAAAGVGVMLWRRSAHRRPPTPPQAASTGTPGTVAPSPPSPPTASGGSGTGPSP